LEDVMTLCDKCHT